MNHYRNYYIGQGNDQEKQATVQKHRHPNCFFSQQQQESQAAPHAAAVGNGFGQGSDFHFFVPEMEGPLKVNERKNPPATCPPSKIPAPAAS